MVETDPVKVTKELVRIDSTEPGNYEGDMAFYIKNYLGKLPDSVVDIKEEEVLDGRRNIMASICADNAEPNLVFMCHMDTVPVGNSWTCSPFDAREENECIYGRGACDMKSGFSCALTAFAETAEKVRKGMVLKRGLKLIATVDEEDEMRGGQKALQSGWISKEDYILDTEPTSCHIQSGHKGRLWFNMTITGKAAHASEPWEGVDAIAGMSEAVSYIYSHIDEFPKDDYFGKTTVCFGQIKGGTVPYAVSDSCTVTIDMRLVPPATAEDACHLIDRAISYASHKIPGITGKYIITGNKMPIPFYKDSPFLNEIKEAYCKVLKTDAVFAPFTGYTDSAVASGVLGSHNCLSFGPGDLKLAHKPDEYVPIKDIVLCKSILNELIEKHCFTSGSSTD